MRDACLDRPVEDNRRQEATVYAEQDGQGVDYGTGVLKIQRSQELEFAPFHRLPAEGCIRLESFSLSLPNETCK